MKQLPWLAVSCPPGGEDLLWAFHTFLKESQVESTRGLDETLSPLIPVVCAELLQSWKALGKTVWFSARAQLQLGNSGVFCCSWFLVRGIIVLQSTFHLIVTVSGFPDTRTPGVCAGLLRRMEKKALWFSPPCSSQQQCSLQHYQSINRPSAQQLLPPPTRPSLCPLQRVTVPLRSSDGLVRMTECSMLLIHQTLQWPCLDKHREKHCQFSTEFQNLLHFY